MLSTVARARGGVGPTRGITVKRSPGARATAVMPQVTTTLGRSHSSDAPGDDPPPGAAELDSLITAYPGGANAKHMGGWG